MTWRKRLRNGRLALTTDAAATFAALVVGEPTGSRAVIEVPTILLERLTVFMLSSFVISLP
ncbi:hypothetical protein [Pararhizobium sp. LjRoot238]|uniref:hypothetical protein n=1 Tax=Pararhizobium sp. LjRoot238 TaxID=3342293 RepID=UPI003ECCEF51